jgi:UPF0755 protein
VTDQSPPAPLLEEASDGASKKRSRRGHRRSRRKAAVAVFLALLLLGGMATVGVVGVSRIYNRFAEGTADFPGPGTVEKTVQIKVGSSVRGIGRMLTTEGIIRTEGSFVAAARDDSRATALQPGFYKVKEQMRARDALQLLLDPNSRILARVTIPEGRTVDETLTRLAKESGLPITSFRAALAKPTTLGLPTWAAGRPEGFLFPATYDIEPDATATAVLKMMTTRFKQALADTDLVNRAAAVGRTPYQVLTIASLVQEEAKNKVDFPKVSRVIYNRLEKKMRLQLDTTVIYASGKNGLTTTAADRAIDSPYNTYKVEGLPQGPIDSPGQDAIEAALAPADGPWLYFVAVNPTTGETKYGVTAAEHARNVKEFQTWLRAHPNG